MMEYTQNIAVKIWILSMFLYGTSARWYPLVGHTKGQPWPMPTSFKQTENTLSLPEEIFSFNISGVDCDILNSAADRYYEILFQVFLT